MFRFEEVFVGCGQDKIVHFTELSRANYKYAEYCLLMSLTNQLLGSTVSPIRLSCIWTLLVWVLHGARALIRYVINANWRLNASILTQLSVSRKLKHSIAVWTMTITRTYRTILVLPGGMKVTCTLLPVSRLTVRMTPERRSFTTR